MTEGQLRFRSLMEDQRHNLAMERFERDKTIAQSQQASAALQNAETNIRNAITREKELAQTKTQFGWDVGFKFASYLFPDANTALKAGAQVIGALFG